MIYQQMYHNGKIKKQKKIANFATKILSWLPHMNVDSKQICKKNTVKFFTVVLYVEDISQTKFSKSDQNEMFGLFLSSGGGAYGALRNENHLVLRMKGIWAKEEGLWTNQGWDMIFVVNIYT